MALRGISATAGGNARFRRRHIGTGVSPWADAWYFMDSGRIDVRASNSWTAANYLGTFDIRVEKINPALNPTHTQPDPLSDFGPDGDLAGVLQKVGNRAIWGYTAFLDGSSLTRRQCHNQQPGRRDITTLVPAMKTKPFATSTPLAETLYVATQYFKQKNAEITGYPRNCHRSVRQHPRPLLFHNRTLVFRSTAPRASSCC